MGHRVSVNRSMICCSVSKALNLGDYISYLARGQLRQGFRKCPSNMALEESVSISFLPYQSMYCAFFAIVNYVIV